MRKVFLTMALVGLLVIPVLAQFRGGFGGGQLTGDALLMNKSVQEELKLTDDQKKIVSEVAKRFAQISIQVATKNNDANIFKNDDVVKALKLTDKQKASVKETLSDLEKDAKEVMDDAKDDFRTKGKAAFTKVAGLRKEAYEKITKALTDDQSKAFKELAGDKFELKMEKGGFNKGGKGGKNKKDKKDDF